MEQLVADLSKRLRSYIDKRHGLNISQGAHHLNEEYNLVYRLVNGRQKTISFTAACNILSQIAPEEYRSILGEYFPDDMRNLQKLIKASDENPIAALNQKVLSFFQNDLSFKIYVVLLSGLRVTVADIKEEFGRQGVVEIERLAKEGSLQILESQVIESEVAEFVKPAQDTIKRHLQLQLGNVDLNIPGTQIENLVGAVSKEGLGKVYEIISDAVKKLKDVIEHDKGDIIVLSSLFTGPFSKCSEESK
jgi:hypothetical protein